MVLRTTTLLAAAAALLSAGCATTAPKQQPPPNLTTTEIEITVREVDQDMVSQLQAEMQKVPELRSAALKSHGERTAVFTVLYPGDIGSVPRSLARIPRPGLKYASAVHKYEYGAFDNEPPTIAILHPQPQQILNSREQHVTVEVPDKDVAQVNIGGKPASRYKGNIFRLKVDLPEGPQEIVATAKDRAGNETSAKVACTVDTTAPALEAQVKLVVEGAVEPGSSVLIDGMEVPVDGRGQYRAEVPVRKGQKKVEIVAIDSSGNKTTQVKTFGE
jgi:glucodextranase-like protein